MIGIKNQLLLLVVFFMLPISVLSDDKPLPDPKEGLYPESPSGMWILKDVQIKIEKNNWKGNERELTLFAKWNDFLKIEHIIDCQFKWSTFPSELRPDTETEFATEFINKEYSTTSNLQTGIRVILTGIKPLKVFELNKNFSSHQSEKKNIKVLIPKHNENKELKITVECYSGQGKYNTTYIYEWRND